MVFSDLFFLFVFLPAFLLCYLLATWIDRKWQPTQENRTNQAKNLILVCFSLIFYAWGEPVYVFLMLFCVLVNYLVGLGIANSENHRKLVLTIGLILNIAIIGTFKYLGFLADCLNDLGLAVARPNIALPIGISFYTFQSISYLIDVYRRESPVQRRFIDLLLYISMFPQLIAGPIVRYGTVAEELHHRHVNAADFADGIYRFLIGLGKKVIIANQLSEISDQFLVSGLKSLTLAGAWIGVVNLDMQAASEVSNSITDFWRRWHISLGSFFRDYVYIPLGGNRHHQAVNILVVWFLTGMWHGASWNFIIWGVYFGLIVMMEKYTLLRVHERIPAFVLHIYSMLLVIAGWGIFYFDNFDQMVVFFNAFFGNVASVYDFVDESALLDNFWLWVVALFFCLPVRTTIGEWTDRLLGDSKVKSVLVYSTRIVLSVAILILSTALLVGATNNAFIYTRF